MQRQEREGTGKVEGNIKLDLREQDWRPPGVEKGWGRGAPLSRGCPCAAPTGDRVPACSDYLRRDRACLKGDGLLLGVAGKAAGTLRSGFRRARLSLSAGCHALRHDGRVQPACSWTISQELGVGGDSQLLSRAAAIVALCVCMRKPMWMGAFTLSRLARYKEAPCPKCKK